jgi:threonine/homoserine/homoserine lactone efflux protein
VTLESWLLFCATELVLSLTPGPAVMLVVSLGMTRGARNGVRASCGILTANALYFAVSATGLGALLLASWNVFFAVKWLGAAYLAWIGTGMLLRKPDPASPMRAPARGNGFRVGFLVNASNPKNLVFFAAILPQFIDPRGPLASQVAILAVSSLAIELIVLVGYALLAERAQQLVRTPRAQAWVQRTGGLLLIAAAARIAAIRRGEPAAALP